MIELTSMENGVVYYRGEFYSDDDFKDWPPISSFVAFMSSDFLPSPGRYIIHELYYIKIVEQYKDVASVF